MGLGDNRCYQLAKDNASYKTAKAIQINNLLIHTP